MMVHSHAYVKHWFYELTRRLEDNPLRINGLAMRSIAYGV